MAQAPPILIWQPGGGTPPHVGFPVPAQGYLYYWPSIENLTGGLVETDLDAQNIAALPADSLIIVITEDEGETHWLRVTDASDAVTDLDAGVIVPEGYDSILRPYVLHQQDIGSGTGGDGGGITNFGVAPLIEGQAYVEVFFPGTALASADWLFLECQVVNTVDPTPLNIWPGILTVKDASGFTLQLNGMPDSGNYELHWAISGTTVALPEATTYTLSGPSDGFDGVESTPFTVALTVGTTVPEPVIVIPVFIGLESGTFEPEFVTLTTAAPSAIFTFTPGVAGETEIGVTNDGGLTDPDPLTYTAEELVEATTYTLSGPALIGKDEESSDFTVEIGVGESLPAPVTVTPSDGGAGGTFTPTTVELTTASPSATFTYTPSTYGARTIDVTNDGGLIDPDGIEFLSVATTYTFSGPSSGTVGVASTDFTVALPVGGELVGTSIVTPSDGGGGGTFTPTTATLTTVAPSDTFTYTPASVGAKTLSVTNDGGLTNPGNLTYTSNAVSGLADGDPVALWEDSSGNGNDATMTGSNRPIFKTAIVNGEPVVRFTVAGSSKLNLTTPISGASPWCIFAVFKPAGATDVRPLTGNSPSGQPTSPFYQGSGGLVFAVDRGQYAYVVSASSVFRVYAAVSFTMSGTDPSIFLDGSIQTVTLGPTVNSGNFAQIGWDGLTGYSDGDIAEILIYNAALVIGDFNNINAYLGAKYAISVSGGGSVIDPTTVSGLVGWWKADSLL